MQPTESRKMHLGLERIFRSVVNRSNGPLNQYQWCEIFRYRMRMWKNPNRQNTCPERENLEWKCYSFSPIRRILSSCFWIVRFCTVYLFSLIRNATSWGVNNKIYFVVGKYVVATATNIFVHFQYRISYFVVKIVYQYFNKIYVIYSWEIQRNDGRNIFILFYIKTLKNV